MSRSRRNGTVQKFSMNSYGWNSTPRGICIATAEGDVDVFIPGTKQVGDHGNLYYTVTKFPNGDVEVYSNMDYTIGNFPNSRRTNPSKTVIFLATKVGDFWDIVKNDLPTKPSPPNTYWPQFGRFYWDV